MLFDWFKKRKENKRNKYNFTKKRVVGSRTQVYDKYSSQWYYADTVSDTYLTLAMLDALTEVGYNPENISEVLNSSGYEGYGDSSITESNNSHTNSSAYSNNDSTSYVSGYSSIVDSSSYSSGYSSGSSSSYDSGSSSSSSSSSSSDW